ncbi:MAG: hypothetical protein IJ419_13800 [Agathobacter sp.]|nr:hypothetical protein [Agathobacter sp.]
MKKRILATLLLLVGGIWLLGIIAIAMNHLAAFSGDDGLLSVILSIEWLWQFGASLVMIVLGMFISNS